MTDQHLLARINTGACFESQDGWSAGYTLAKKNGPGVTVGPGVVNANVFAQSFAVNTHKYFRLVARAQGWSDPPGEAKFQINWLGKEGEFISTSQRCFEITGKEITTAEYQVKAPDGAVTGVIYVVPGSSDNRVQYYEMSLYPDSGPVSISSFMHHSDLVGGNSRIRSPGDEYKGSTDRPEKLWKSLGENKPLCFVHIPKTAGHSMYHLLEKNYPRDALVIPYQGVQGNIHAILNLTHGEKEKARIFAGHMPVGLHNYIGECNYITFLREPFELTVSGYYYNLESRDAPNHSTEVCINRTLLQFAEYHDNVMTRYLMSCAFSEATCWLSGETNPGIKGVSYLGLDCTAELTVRTVALQQWNAPLYPSRFLAPGVMEEVAVECSNDNFNTDVRLAGVLTLKQDRELHSYSIPDSHKGRFWRIRALSSPQTARWGVVALKFFEQDVSMIPSVGYEHLVVRGIPVCSSAEEDYPALHAFDGRDRMAQWQIPPNALEMCHCEEAMNNLRERFLFGLIEKYDQSIEMMCKVFNWPVVAREKRNANPILRNASILSDYEKKQIAEINRYDILLYEYARKIFLSDLKNF